MRTQEEVRHRVEVLDELIMIAQKMVVDPIDKKRVADALWVATIQREQLLWVLGQDTLPLAYPQVTVGRAE